MQQKCVTVGKFVTKGASKLSDIRLNNPYAKKIYIYTSDKSPLVMVASTSVQRKNKLMQNNTIKN